MNLKSFLKKLFNRKSFAELVRDEHNDLKAFFDVPYYLSNNPDVNPQEIDPILHYLQHGEKEGRRPRADFDPLYYNRVNPDLAGATFSGFWHYVKYGKAEMRSPSAYYTSDAQYRPLVSVIVPNYNHARFLEKRLQSIVAQTYDKLEIIVLDDKSTDNSIEVIKALCDQIDTPIHTYFNTENSGNVFAQWKKGIGLANGELIWICESDDFCEADFLEHMVPHFADLSVNAAFGRIQFCDADGEFMEGLDAYRETAEPGIWGHTLKRPARSWFECAMGNRNVMSNVGGCLLRKQPLPDHVWDTAQQYRIAGDWYLYSEIANGGQIVFEPAAVAYFRQHGKNTSASNFIEPYYFREHAMILKHLIEMWGNSEESRLRLIDKIRAEFVYHKMEDAGHKFEDLIPVDSLMALSKKRTHIQLAFLGFHSGGGEEFPINLANILNDAGYTVSMVAMNLHSIRAEMLLKLNKRIAVYDAYEAAIEGRAHYLIGRGVDLIHSHMASCEHFFFGLSEDKIEVPYVVSLHGSHDTMDISSPHAQNLLDKCLRNIDAWVYTADKNLKIFKDRGLSDDLPIKIDNAMPADPRDFPQTRKDLGIDPDTFVFTFVARGIERKGWRAVVMAFQALQNRSLDQKMHLILVGDGEKADQAMEMVRETDNISYLGYQSHINGLYRLSDCAVIPTRFPGESNPLCLIQAAQEHLPIIATDIGDIKNMLTVNKSLNGILLQPQRRTLTFAADLCDAMAEMLEPDTLATYQNGSKALARKFSVSRMLKKYELVYNSVIEEQGKNNQLQSDQTNL